MENALLVSLVVFAIAYFFIVTEKFDRTATAVLGAALVVFLRCIPYEDALHKIDMNVLFLLIGMMIVVNVLSETGLFEWVAVFIAQKAQGNGLAILLGLMIATAVLSAFLDNVTTVVLIAPITILITQILELNAVPFLILEAMCSNIGGTATLVGDPPNILVGSASNLSFNTFMANLSPLVIICMVIMVAFVYFRFRKNLKVTAAARERIMKAQPHLAITDPQKLKRALPIFFLILLGFAGSHALHIEPGIVALAGAFVLLVATGANLRVALEKVEWETILFLIGLFMLVAALEHNHLFEMMAVALFKLTQGHMYITALAILWLSGFLAAFLGAIPVVISLIPLVQSLMIAFNPEVVNDPLLMHETPMVALWWALALGACFGGNGTLLGTAANVVVVQIARKNEYNVSFFAFAKQGLPIMVMTLIVSSMYIYFRYFWGIH